MMKTRARCTRQICLSPDVRSAFHQTVHLSSQGCRRTACSSSQPRNPTERTGSKRAPVTPEWRASAFPQDAQRDAEETPLQPCAPTALRGAGPNAGRLGEAPGAGSPIHEAREAQRLLPGEARRLGTSVRQTLSKGFFSNAHVRRVVCATILLLEPPF